MRILTPSNEARPGDILFGKNNRNIGRLRSHYIIYLNADPSSKEQFLGAMITHSPGHQNIALSKDHFLEVDERNQPWKVTYETSFIASSLYHKKNDWRPFTKVGQLSKSGISFVESHLFGKTPIDFPFNRI